MEDKEYYTSREILEAVNEKCGLNLVKNPSTYQWLYRHSLPKSAEKDKHNAYLYDKSAAEEIINYFWRKQEIKRLKKKLEQDSLETKRELKALRDANKEFTAKYKTW